MSRARVGKTVLRLPRGCFPVAIESTFELIEPFESGVSVARSECSIPVSRVPRGRVPPRARREGPGQDASSLLEALPCLVGTEGVRVQNHRERHGPHHLKGTRPPILSFQGGKSRLTHTTRNAGDGQKGK